MEDITQLSELGFNGRRLPENPQEVKNLKVFVNEFDEKFCHNQMDLMVFGSERGNTPRQYLTDREKKVALSTIQWLGSPCGVAFLRDCGYELKREK
jgi:hypothetical protein